jgi:hypothetical protein
MKKSNRRRKSMLSREQIDQMVPPSATETSLMLTLIFAIVWLVNRQPLPQVETLLNKMGDAVDADIRAIQENSPAVAKVKLLPEVIAMLQKYMLHQLSTPALKTNKNNPKTNRYVGSSSLRYTECSCRSPSSRAVVCER